MAAWRVTLDREQFRRLVAGREVVTEAGPVGDTIVVNLDLDFVPGMQRWTDPPEAAEFYKRPEPDALIDDVVKRQRMKRR